MYSLDLDRQGEMKSFFQVTGPEGTIPSREVALLGCPAKIQTSLKRWLMLMESFLFGMMNPIFSSSLPKCHAVLPSFWNGSKTNIGHGHSDMSSPLKLLFLSCWWPDLCAGHPDKSSPILGFSSFSLCVYISFRFVFFSFCLLFVLPANDCKFKLPEYSLMANSTYPGF